MTTFVRTAAVCTHVVLPSYTSLTFAWKLCRTTKLPAAISAARYLLLYESDASPMLPKLATAYGEMRCDWRSLYENSMSSSR